MATSYTFLPEGTILFDNFRIERMLGQGGFGITYLATDLALERLVAIKEFFPKDFCDREGDTSQVSAGTSGNRELIEKLKNKFLKEARNIAKFNCPYIIKIFATFEENNTAYYVMEYIEGENLRDMVKRDGPLQQLKAVDYIKKIGEALSYIHSHHINHLDVKPANIMVRRSDNIPILIDFGLSKEYNAGGQQTSTTPTGISHGFAPIEQYNSAGLSEFSPATDLYSLAATLYYLLTGNVPPEAPQLTGMDLNFPDYIPPYLQGAISKAMSVVKRDRYHSVRDFIDAVENKHLGANEDTALISGASAHKSPSAARGNNDERTLLKQPGIYDTPYSPPAEPVKKNTGALNKYLFIGAALVIVVLATILITLLFSRSSQDNAVAQADSALVLPTADSVMVIEEDILEPDTSPAQEVREVQQPEEYEEPARPLNDSPYPIAPGNHKFEGNADGNLPIVVYIDVSSGGSVSGKMAYKKILKQYGDSPKRYMYFNGSFSGDNLSLSVDDEKGNHQEWSLHVSDNGSKYILNGSAYSYTRDKTFSISISGK